MSEVLCTFRAPGGDVAVALPFDLERIIADWGALRPAMTRTVPAGFERDEWAYLIQFLEASNLMGAYRSSFGEPVAASDAGHVLLARPRGTVAVWLPNNVSLLGPLVLILLSITGNPILLKGGSQSEDLTGAFLAFARENLADGPLREHLENNVRFEVFERGDARNLEYARDARVRIVFGSDQAAAAIDALPHPIDSVGFSFVDRRSEAWVDRSQLDDALLETLIKVFAIYGQAGCTSPRRVVLLDADRDQAVAVRDRMLALWPRVVRGRPAQHIASSCAMAQQWARSLGWDALVAPENAAVLAAGSAELESFGGPMSLPIVGTPIAAAIAQLPENIQTIGYAVAEPTSARWLSLVARTRAKRFVPLGRMHHFGPIWDGTDFWRQTFEQVETAP